MTRWSVVIVLAACSYSPPRVSSNADGAPGDQAVTPPDEAIDAPPGPIVRAIDIVDGKVTGGPHAEFPLLVSLTASTLRTTANGGRVEHPQGFDIQFFADASATMQLAHEVEQYDGAAGRMIAWVKIPSLGNATTLFVRYSDPSITTDSQQVAAVWSASFAAVFHLSATGDALGTSPGTNNGSTASDGTVLGARAFDGSNQRIDVAPTTAIANVFAGGGTVEAWAFAEGTGGNNLGRVFEKGTVVRMGRCDNVIANSMFFAFEFTNTAGTWCSPAASTPLNQWVHFAAVYDRNSTANVPTLYVNGAPVTATLADTAPSGTPRSDATDTLAIGDRGDGARTFDGRIDELRFARTQRDAGWIATSYENQRDPAAFVQF